MKNKKDKMTVIIISTLLLVVIGFIVTIVLCAQSNKKISELTSDYNVLKTEVEELKVYKEKLETGNSAQAKTAEIQNSETPDESETVTASALDMVNIPAGTIIEGEKIDSENLSQYFCSYEIPEDVITRISGKSYRENDDIGLDELRYLKLLHYNFSGQIQMGELIVNAAVVDDILEIFQQLYQNQYQIESMYLVDNYWIENGEKTDTNSIEHNNTSAFCYREQTGGGVLSNHALGRAIDINPQQNPYVSFSSGSPYWYHDNADAYIDRESGALHMITHDDLCYQLFIQHGFKWGGDWTSPKDYQHFEKE
ncbi:MAG: M15 family metallopeptidase [Lachnospiraceae bacterium]|nr:M15 family metallopeptidase [Lachnospiraceae bacterium]MDD3617336.1 M15 family metallopeptidase [Lachnospiraceae bacterium]